MPRSARWRDGEYLATRRHEVIRMAWMAHLGKARIQYRAHQGRRIIGL